jgi:hypothetical protein
MLNIYRVISLSLLMSLFFAAPLLCVHPVSIQQKKAHALATKRQQVQRVAVAWQRTSHKPYVTSTDRLADSLRQADFVPGQDEDWDADEREGRDGVNAAAGTGGVRTISHSSLYY